MKKFRDYLDSTGEVERTYQNMYERQTIDFVLKKKDHYSEQLHANMGLWKALDLLETIVDESDPDTDAKQIVHAFQTAESLEQRIPECTNVYGIALDWLPLVGLLHDLGKVMMLEEFGGIPQWGVVGDTFPVGYPLSSACVFYGRGFHADNPSLNGEQKRYEPGCGFDRVHFSWSHDEYMARVLERSNTNLPWQAIYIVRYHSFYAFHTPRNLERGYLELASEKDVEMLPLLRLFQKSDLYSKRNKLPDPESKKKKYSHLMKKYIPHDLVF